ncbi:MAG: MaoC family dehydratase [Alphaproteobacteria bacterium GM202ARS2]|nr:MaoC family dehydratase [Alphaproteobacteria bacterium GM202ARS2]
MTRDSFLQLAVSQRAERVNVVSQESIAQFASVSGDNNPLHTDSSFAEQTMFKGIIAHGFLTASFISAVIGNDLPGAGCVYLSQQLRFKAPVRAGDSVRTEVTITAIDAERRRVTLACVCSVGKRVVLEGDALIYVPPLKPSS